MTAPRRGATVAGLVLGVMAAISTQTPAARPAQRDDAATVPPLLDGLLRAHPSWQLLNPDRHPVGDYTRADLIELHHWPPWSVGDFDRDGRADVAAVIVTDGTDGLRYGVAAVHASQPGRPHWIVPVASRPYLAAAVYERTDVVTAAHCLECDTNTWYRWNGRAYEALLYATGETVVFGDAPSQPAPQLFEREGRGARPIAIIEPCSRGRVHRVGGRPGHRWYLVDVAGAAPTRGWVPAERLTETIDCAG